MRRVKGLHNAICSDVTNLLRKQNESGNTRRPLYNGKEAKSRLRWPSIATIRRFVGRIPFVARV